MKERKKETNILQKYKTLVITPGGFKMGHRGNPLGKEEAPRMDTSTWSNQTRENQNSALDPQAQDQERRSAVPGCECSSPNDKR